MKILSEDAKTRLQLGFGFLLFFLDALCFAQIGPFFPTEALHKGSSVVMIGVAIGCFDAAGIFTSFIPVFMGMKSNRNLFIFGSTVRGLSTVSFSFVCFISNIKLFNAVCIIIRSLMGIGSFLVWVTGMPYLVSLDPKRAAITIGLVEAADALGGIVGPPLGSLLYSQAGFLLPFLATGVLSLIFSPLGLAILKNPPDDSNKHATSLTTNVLHSTDTSESRETLLGEKRSKSFKTFLTNPKILISVSPHFIASTTLGYIGVSFGPYLEKTYAIYGNRIGYYFIIFAVSSAITSALTGKLVEAGFGVYIYSFSSVMASLSFFLLFLPVEIPGLLNLKYFLSLLAFLGAIYSVACVAVLLICEKVASIENFVNLSQTKQFVATLWILTFSFGRMFGSFLIGGVVLSKLGFYWTNLVLSVLSIMTAAVCFVTLMKLRLFNFTK